MAEGKRVALLIGVGSYPDGSLNPLHTPPQNVAKLQAILENPNLGAFEVTTLIDPDPLQMRSHIEDLFANRRKNDLVLLYFSGHGVKDDRNQLYLSSCQTQKRPSGELIKSTALEAEFVRKEMEGSLAQQQVIILDCCFSGAFPDGVLAMDDGTVDVQGQLSGPSERCEGRAIMTAATSTQYALEQQNEELSVYSRYLIEGLATGAKVPENREQVWVSDLHEYVREKVAIAASSMQPALFAAKEGGKIWLSKVQLDNDLRFRKEVEQCVVRGRIPKSGEGLLQRLALRLQISPERASELKESVLRPYREKEANLNSYHQLLQEEVEEWDGKLPPEVVRILKRLQQELKLTDEDVKPFWAEVNISPPAEAIAPQPLPSTPLPSTPLPSTPLRELPAPASTSNVDLPATDRTSHPVVERSRNHDFSIDLGKGIQLEMIAIPGGKFLMGSPAGEGADDEKPQHEVAIAPFYIGKYPITQEQYEAVMGKNPSHFKGAKRPVEKVSWDEAVEFCRKLSEKSKRSFRLPSEAEWEYACRAGTTTKYSFGDRISKENVNFENHYKGTTEVGRFPANAFGLHDMHGNVWEWCADHWHANYQGAPKDGSAWVEKGENSRLLRGGSWFSNLDYCRSAYRSHLTPGSRHYGLGFRVACS